MAFAWWTLTAGANGALAILYAGIAFFVIRGIAQGHQWRSNPLAVATAGIFATCGVGHGLHVLHVIPPLSILDPVSAANARLAFADPRLIVWDAATATVAVWYWIIRSRLEIVYEGAALCADMEERQRQAAALNDKVVEALARAQAEIDAGRREAGLRLLEDTLRESKTIITTLLGARGKRSALGPGDLRRDAASP